jgi:hypothetical protein
MLYNALFTLYHAVLTLHNAAQVRLVFEGILAFFTLFSIIWQIGESSLYYLVKCTQK